MFIVSILPFYFFTFLLFYLFTFLPFYFFTFLPYVFPNLVVHNDEFSCAKIMQIERITKRKHDKKWSRLKILK